eukprot:4856628-Pleurochrysis_carterae.AAC.1
MRRVRILGIGVGVGGAMRRVRFLGIGVGVCWWWRCLALGGVDHAGCVRGEIMGAAVVIVVVVAPVGVVKVVVVLPVARARWTTGVKSSVDATCHECFVACTARYDLGYE